MPDYYPKLGFKRARDYDLTLPDGTADDSFMAYELSPGYLSGGGTLHFLPPEFEGVPIGFCQYYDCFYARRHEVWNDQWRIGEKRGEIFSIDYLIGEPSSLRRGFGKEMIAKMLDMLRKAGARTVIVEPERDNAASNRALEANGFIWNGTDYYLELQGNGE